MPKNRSGCNGITSICAGLFIVWQLVFVLAANLVGILRGVPPEVVRYEMADGAWRESLDRTAARPNATSDSGAASSGIVWLTDRWSEATGQWQGWAMFAPNVPMSSYFLATTLRWNDAELSRAPRKVVLPSPFEPANPHAFFIPALPTSRRFNFEWRLALGIEICKSRDEAGRVGGDTMQHDTQLREWMARQAEPLRAYARVRLQEWSADHPAVPPADEVILSVGEYRRVDVTTVWKWQALPRRLLLRWRPSSASEAHPTGPAVVELEWYDASTASFIPLITASSFKTSIEPTSGATASSSSSAVSNLAPLGKPAVAPRPGLETTGNQAALRARLRS
ncbi:MAG: hypothetical protein K2Y37_15185 [Pirellulales bacterium]|nr:hypothetical protein [Pirellulales bacterium]